MAKQLTWEQAIVRVLVEAEEPLHYIEISDRIVAGEFRTSLGATPAATVASVLCTTIKRDGERAPWVRLGKGTYGPASQMPGENQSAIPSSSDSEPEERDEEEQYAVVSSFGMYWSRDAVEWVRSPRILGKQYGGSTQVNFCDQVGVYLLYDGREVIYVGRATERGLGIRLYEHTWDRLASRWDRFSWFGLSPVGEDGTLRSMPATFDASKLGPALEAILVEAVEPRQNRKRGDDLAQVEYLQVEDPAVRRRALKAALDEAIR